MENPAGFASGVGDTQRASLAAGAPSRFELFSYVQRRVGQVRVSLRCEYMVAKPCLLGLTGIEKTGLDADKTDESHSGGALRP